MSSNMLLENREYWKSNNRLLGQASAMTEKFLTVGQPTTRSSTQEKEGHWKNNNNFDSPQIYSSSDLIL